MIRLVRAIPCGCPGVGERKVGWGVWEVGAKKEQMKQVRVNCFICKHFYITWESAFPNGCRAFGFKTKHFPSEVIRSSSDMRCLHFVKKDSR